MCQRGDRDRAQRKATTLFLMSDLKKITVEATRET